MTPESQNPLQPDGDDAHDERIGTLVNEFFDRCERGENLTQEKFLDEHPAEAAELREHLVGLDLIARAGSSAGAAKLPGQETVAAKGSSAAYNAPEKEHIPTIDGYDIHRMIGRGGMGVVYKATQISTKRQIALKVLLEGPLATEQSRKRFEREIEVAAQLRHSNIIPIYDSGKCDGRMFYAMAYVRGLSLSDHLAAKRSSTEEKLYLFVKICQAVRHAHQRGVMHRDLKPSNVLVDTEGEPHILDFGLAKLSALSDMTTSVSAQIVGTPAYMSPEQAAGDPAGIDTRTDIYSLGVVLYEMLTGRMPYDTTLGMAKLLDRIANVEPDPPNQVDRKISGELSAIVMKALEKNKERRYQSLDTFQSDVEKFLKGEPISVKPATAMYLLSKTLWRHRVTVGSGGALLLIALFVALVVNYYSGKIESKTAEYEQKKLEIAAERAKLQRDTEEANRKTAEANRLTEEANRLREQTEQQLANTDAFIAKLSPTLAEAARAIRGGVPDPRQMAELIAQGARELTQQSAPIPSKLSSIDPMAPIEFEPPAMSGKPVEQTVREPDLLAKIGEAAKGAGQAAQQVFIPGLPQAMAETTSKPATSQPADPWTSQPAEPPTTQPISSSLIQADAADADGVTSIGDREGGDSAGTVNKG
ncbi:MAG TPA: protein kinase [Woeseiaceae bacterium]|nr:protein kinase [Woeseiaceae bacterium]